MTPSSRHGTFRTVLAALVRLPSVGPREPQDRKGAVGLPLVASVTRLACRDPVPRLRALVSLELRGGHPVLLAADLDPDLIGMRGDVVIPGRMAGGSPADATISQAPSESGNLLTVDSGGLTPLAHSPVRFSSSCLSRR